MKLYSYVVTHDTGFSPNPFWGCCTLADCKPAIRRTAREGDWLVGLSPRANGNRVIYAMQIDEILPYAAYYRDERFAAKIPDFGRGEVVYKCGDNIYEPWPDGGYRQKAPSMHSDGLKEDPQTKAHDLGGANVLISWRFHYFGKHGPELPEELRELRVGRGHKSRFLPEVITRFLEFISAQPKGISGPPTRWPTDDRSWRQAQP